MNSGEYTFAWLSASSIAICFNFEKSLSCHVNSPSDSILRVFGMSSAKYLCCGCFCSTSCGGTAEECKKYETQSKTYLTLRRQFPYRLKSQLSSLEILSLVREDSGREATLKEFLTFQLFVFFYLTCIIRLANSSRGMPIIESSVPSLLSRYGCISS